MFKTILNKLEIIELLHAKGKKRKSFTLKVESKEAFGFDSVRRVGHIIFKMI